MRPSGTVTYLFTDLEGSTRLWEDYPQAMKAALARHDRILQKAIEEHKGLLVKQTGDGFHAAFARSTEAVEAVLAAQLAISAQPWPETGPLRVRMALHTGEAQWREGDYYGPAVNRAARLMSLAAGGQVLLSATTAELVRDQLPPEATLLDLGRHYLKDLARREHIFQLQHPDLAAAFPPLKTAGSVPNNLPAQLTSFIGREADVAALVQLLAPGGPESQNFGGPRLITLTGPGGTGKSRLSLEAAEGVLDQFPDGVWLVELAPLADAEHVVQAVAAPLGLHEHLGRPLLDALSDYLRPRRALLILDNCEHLIDECARVAAALLPSCPLLRLLASSREALGISGEQAYRVRSLALPPGEDGLSAGEIAGYDSIRLFVERAKAVKKGFALTPENAGAILQICRRLDGIPLAIELAAARVRVLSPDQIAARLDDRFKLLTGGSRSALPRQRTLQALIDWSYDLLSEPERVLLRRLSVFSLGWTLEAAESVAGADPLEAYEVLDLLDQLVGKSLVSADESRQGQRYRLLETIRQYAQEKLAGSGEAKEVRDRHLAYFVEQRRLAMRDAYALAGVERLTALITESDNLRAARAWALEQDLSAALDLGLDQTLQVTRILPPVEGLHYIEDVLLKARDRPEFVGPEAPPENRRLFGAALVGAAQVSVALGMNPQALDYAQQAAQIARREGDINTLANAYAMASLSSFFLGDIEASSKYHFESSELAEQAGNRFLQAMTLFWFRRHDDSAWPEWKRGMDMLREGGDIFGQALGHQLAASYQQATGDIAAAKAHAEKSVALYEEVGSMSFSAPPRSILAELARLEGDLEGSAAMYREVIPLWRYNGNVGALARCLECLAFIEHARAMDPGQESWAAVLSRAATLLGAADVIRRSHEAPMTAVEQPGYDSELAAIREAAGQGAFLTGWQEGQAMDLDQAVAFALEPGD